MRPQLPEGLQATYRHERFERVEAEDARVLLLAGEVSGAQAWASCSPYEPGQLAGVDISPWGGRTVCSVYDGDTHLVTATADCSLADQYSRKLGREIALGRALKELGPGAECS